MEGHMRLVRHLEDAHHYYVIAFLSSHHVTSLLQVLKDATLYFSCLGTPSLATVILAMDIIDKVFATAAVKNTEFSASI